jgi:hypothetical protein
VESPAGRNEIFGDLRYSALKVAGQPDDYGFLSCSPSVVETLLAIVEVRQIKQLIGDLIEH